MLKMLHYFLFAVSISMVIKLVTIKINRMLKNREAIDSKKYNNCGRNFRF